jgi:hypothetical protein
MTASDTQLTPAATAAGERKIGVVVIPSKAPALTAADRERAAANALASVRAEGLDSSTAEPILEAWARGEIDTDQMIAATRTAAVAQLSTHPGVPSQAA